MICNISLFCATQMILRSPLLSNSVTSQLLYNGKNDIFQNSLNFFQINNSVSFSSILNHSVAKEEIFATKDNFTPLTGVGKSKSEMLIGGLVAISIVFLTNFAILTFYFCVRSKSKENSNELSMSSTLFVNLNQEIKINSN